MSTKKSSSTAGASDTLSTVYGAAQSLQALQQQAMGRVMQRQLQAVSQLTAIKGPMDLVALQVDLMTFGMQEAVQFWSQMASAITQRQQVAAGDDTSTSAATSTANAAGLPINPVLQAWQAMLNPSSLNGAAAHDR